MPAAPDTAPCASQPGRGSRGRGARLARSGEGKWGRRGDCPLWPGVLWHPSGCETSWRAKRQPLALSWHKLPISAETKAIPPIGSQEGLKGRGASSLGRQSPHVVFCLAHSLCPEEPGLQTTAVVSMGSRDHQFNLTEILSQNYSVEGECEEPSRCSDKPKEELEKDFISQSSNMPFDELLALYGYEASEQESEGGNMTPNLLDMPLDMQQIVKDLFSGKEEMQPSADDLTPTMTSHEACDLFPNQCGSRFLADKVKLPGSSASSDTEEGSLPANKCKKEIMVGPQFQADLSSLHLNWPWEKSAWGLRLGTHFWRAVVQLDSAQFSMNSRESHCRLVLGSYVLTEFLTHDLWESLTFSAFEPERELA
ncbi:mesoderm induction early response protein 2-like [Saimiri boliviensis]|uniref:mesoderm induction early response protein 2-like n=1 Tax=Saimiri boliviensis TaxID=27679 RepID=UPI003D775320